MLLDITSKLCRRIVVGSRMDAVDGRLESRYPLRRKSHPTSVNRDIVFTHYTTIDLLNRKKFNLIKITFYKFS